MKKIYVTIIVLVLVAGGVLYVNSKREDIKVPTLDSSYLQTRIGNDLYAAKGQKLERLYIADGEVRREEVQIDSPVPKGSFYMFIGSYDSKLITAYHNSPVIEFFETGNTDKPKSILRLNLEDGVCTDCVALQKVSIEKAKLLYSIMTSDRHSPVFYYYVDLTKEPLENKQITKEEWEQLLAE